MRLSRAPAGAGRARTALEGASRWLVAALAGVAAAVAAGTLPDVIKGWLGEQRWLLTGLCLTAAVVFAGINLWQQRSRGVGIVISLPRDVWREPWSGQWTAAAAHHARQNHDSCFTVRQDVTTALPGASPEVRKAAREARLAALDLAHRLATARLTEISEADPSTPVSLYVNAALPDAFELGAKFKFNVQRELRGVGADPEDIRLSKTPVLPQRSESGQADFFPAIRISGRLKEPLDAAEQVKADRIAQVVEEPDFAGDPAGTAVALVVHLADNPQMVAQALHAAAVGCLDTKGRFARCRAALVIDGRPANIPETAADFELAVRQVYAAWRTWSRSRPEYRDLRTRVFLATPACVAFALGWLIGHAADVVAHPYETGEPCTSS